MVTQVAKTCISIRQEERKLEEHMNAIEKWNEIKQKSMNKRKRSIERR